MPLIAKASAESTFKPVPSGSHLARCYRIVDLGTQKSEFAGKVKQVHKVMFQFEIHSEDDDGTPLVTDKGEPLSISKNFTLSLGEKSVLRQDLEAWRGRAFNAEELRGFELKNVLNAWCLLTVTRESGRDGKDYTNIAGISPVPKAMKGNLPQGHNPAELFSIDEPDMEVFENLSDRIKQKIMDSPEWKARSEPKSSREIESDIPF